MSVIKSATSNKASIGPTACYPSKQGLPKAVQLASAPNEAGSQRRAFPCLNGADCQRISNTQPDRANPHVGFARHLFFCCTRIGYILLYMCVKPPASATFYKLRADGFPVVRQLLSPHVELDPAPAFPRPELEQNAGCSTLFPHSFVQCDKDVPALGWYWWTLLELLPFARSLLFFLAPPGKVRMEGTRHPECSAKCSATKMCRELVSYDREWHDGVAVRFRVMR